MFSMNASSVSGGYRRDSRQHRKSSAGGRRPSDQTNSGRDSRKHSRVSMTGSISSGPEQDIVVVSRRPPSIDTGIPMATTSTALPVEARLTMPDDDIPLYGQDGSINITYKILKEIMKEMALKKVKGQTAPFIPHYPHTQQIDYIFHIIEVRIVTQIARFMGPTWGPAGADRTHVGPMLAHWTLLSGYVFKSQCKEICPQGSK